MTLHIRDTAANFKADTTEGPVRFRNWIDCRGLTPDQRQRVMQHVVRDAQAARAQAPHDLGGAVLRALQAATGGAERLSSAHLPRRSSPRPANGGAPTPSNAHASRRYASFIRSMTACSRTLG